MEYGKTIYAIMFYGDGVPLKIATETVSIDNDTFRGVITQFSISKASVDIESGTTSKQSMTLSFAQDNISGSRKVVLHTRCNIYEISHSNISFNDELGLDVQDTKYMDASHIYRSTAGFDQTKKYSGYVSEYSYADGIYSITISFDHNSDISDSLPKFTKETYGQYVSFAGEVVRIETNIMIPDLSPNSSFSLGRYFKESVELFSYTHGTETDVTTSGTTVGITKNNLDIHSINPSSTSPKQIVFRLDDFLNSMRNVNQYGGYDRLPGMKLMASTHYTDTNDSPDREGTQLTFGYDENLSINRDTSNTTDDLTLYNRLDGPELMRTRYGVVLFMRVPIGSSNSMLPIDLEKVIRDMNGIYKLAPFAFLFDRIYIRVDSTDHSQFNTHPLNGRSMHSVFSYLNTIPENASGILYSYGWINVIDKLDLRDRFRDRWGGFIMRTGLVDGGLVEHSGSDGSIRLATGEQPARTGERVALFDPTVLADSTSTLQPDEWMMVIVPSYETIKKLKVPISSFGNIDPRSLIGRRINSTRASVSSSTVINMVDPQGYMHDVETTHSDVQQINNGMYAYIEDINGFSDYDDTVYPHRYDIGYEITLKSPQIGDPDLNIPSIPNTLSRATAEDMTELLYNIEFRTPPENCGDEGSIIPLVYGYVHKAPMIHAISKKADNDPSSFAGDDIYVMCSHRIAQRDSNSVTVWWGLDQMEQGSSPMLDPRVQIGAIENQFDKAKPYWIPNPFPAFGKIMESSYVDVELSDPTYTTTIHQMTERVVSNPLHYLVSVETNQDDIHTGIRLRGDEVSANMPELDVRFNIRNGMGNSKMYASFAGIPDDNTGTYTGVALSPIIHPTHIIKHILCTYAGLDPHSAEGKEFDRMAAIAYSESPEYQLGIRISDTIKVRELLDSIGQQTLIFTIPHFGNYKIFKLNFDPYQQSMYDLTIDQDMIVNTASQFFEKVTNLTVEYRPKYYGSGKYERSISLNKDSNHNLHSAYKRTGKELSKTIKLDYVSHDGTARKIMLEQAKLLGVSRTMLTSTIVRNVYTNDIDLGDVITVTDPKIYNYMGDTIGLSRNKFMVISIEKHQADLSIVSIQIS